MRGECEAPRRRDFDDECDHGMINVHNLLDALEGV